VVIISGDRSVYTDLDGHFCIDRLEPGLYSVRVRLISYEESVTEEVITCRGSLSRVDLLLKPY
jgi:hypothetical protein